MRLFALMRYSCESQGEALVARVCGGGRVGPDLTCLRLRVIRVEVSACSAMINTTECLEVFGSVEEFPFVVAVAFVVIAVMRQLMRFDTVTPHKNL